jgi:hypothetical protein
MSFIVSSYFIEVLGDEDVNLEMPKILGTFGESWQNLFPKHRGQEEQDSRQLELLKRDGAKIVLVENNLSKYDSSNYASVPMVDMALIPLYHTWFLSQNQMLKVCVPTNQVYIHTIQKMDIK